MKHRDIFMNQLYLLLTKRPALWGLLFVFSILSIIDVVYSDVFSFNYFTKICCILGIGALKASIISMLINLMLRFSVSKWAAWIIVCAYGLVSVVNSISYSLYGLGISRKLFTIIAQTNPSEVSEFIPGLASNLLSSAMIIKLIAIILIVVILPYTLCRIPRKVFAIAASALSIIGISLYIWFICHYSFGRTVFFLSVKTPKYVMEYFDGQKQLENLRNKKLPFPYADSVSATHKAENVIIIIGESASRSHHSLYGYPLETNPRLGQLADSLFIFDNVIGSSAATTGNIERILTFKPDDDTYGDWYKFPPIIELLNLSGYDTYWLSSQERTGLVAHASGALASDARHIEYLIEDNRDRMLNTYDEELLPLLTEAMSHTDNAKIVFMHLLGSHTEYQYRYPKGRSRFSASDILNRIPRKWLNEKKAETIAHYDNSIRYTDSIVAEAISEIHNSPAPGLLIYFSDHGEIVYDKNDFIGRSDESVEVPFIIYANRAYREQNPVIISKLNSALHLPISTANYIHPLMTMAGIEYQLYDSSYDFLTDSFKIRHRYVDEIPWKYEIME